MIAGTVYGVVLNDRAERPSLAAAFAAPPYRAPPRAPVLYIKPRNCLADSGAVVRLASDLAEVEAAATIGLLFGQDAAHVAPDEAFGCVAAACLALDVSEPHASYYRPAIRQRCRDGFLPLGRPAAFDRACLSAEIATRVDGQPVHAWSTARLVRDAATLIAEVSAFMTLAAGDLLLVGLPFDAPRVRAGQRIDVAGAGLPGLAASFAAEAVP